MQAASWVIVDKRGNPQFETFSQKTAVSFMAGTSGYKAIPIGQYLGSLNQSIREGVAFADVLAAI